ncbi:MAG TPA: hypothetical protein PLW86_16210, partial [Rhodocyclaceae bacterium]|nr:hypothetical protein [Rhodocyclaceae bacterium]
MKLIRRALQAILEHLDIPLFVIVLCLLGIGLLGVVMRRFDFPTAPVVVGMILGPLAEAQMRNAVALGEG